MAQYPVNIALSSLTAATGLVFQPGVDGAFFGLSISSAGDVNGDGNIDFLIGEPDYHPRDPGAIGPTVAGRTHLLFGGSVNLAAVDLEDGVSDGILNLSLVNGSQGYRFNFGVVGDGSGVSVAMVGNVDGVAGDDLMIGTPRSTATPGTAHFISGGANLAVLDAADGTVDGEILLTNVDGDTGYQFNGTSNTDRTGVSVGSVDDVNGDGFRDLLIGSYFADPPGATNGGEIALIFGDPSNLTTLDGNGDGQISLSSMTAATGYRFVGVAADNAGSAVTGVKDVNGDGIADLLLGAQQGAPGAGEAYLVFGGLSNFQALDVAGGAPADGRISLSAVNGTTGYRFTQTDLEGDNDQFGWAVSGAGDVNADGFEDLLVGNPFSDVVGGNGGAAYLVFGGATNLAALDAADGTTDGTILTDNVNGTTGFRVAGPSPIWAGHSVVGVGDVNGDGYDDVMIGANFRPSARTGAVFVIFGGAAGSSGFNVEDAADGTADGKINLAFFTGTGGVRIDGVATGDQAGFAVAEVGDLNADGMADMMISSVRNQDAITQSGTGEVYVVYSRNPDAAVNRVGTDIGQTIVGSDFVDTLSGQGGNDVLIGNDGGDTFYGGSGLDTASYLSASAGLIVKLLTPVQNTGDAVGDVYNSIENLAGSAFADSLNGNNTANVISGGAGNDSLSGVAGSDTLFGEAGDDKVNGGTGVDTMDGGAGNDDYYVDNIGDVITEAANAGDDDVLSSIDFSLNDGALAHVENVLLTGAGNTDATGNSLGNKLTGNVSANELSGLNGDDRLYGAAGSDTAFGGIGNDQLFGGDGIDSLFGGTGNDKLDGGVGADFLSGGAGNDTYYINDAGDDFTEAAIGDGTDVVFGSVGVFLDVVGREFLDNVTLTGAGSIDATGNALANRLIGNTGVNELSGGAGNDYIDGKVGADTMTGGSGNDTIYVDNVNDRVIEATGEGTNDRVYTLVNYTLDAGVEVEFLNALAGATDLSLFGNEFANRITGGGNNDILFGDGGNDRLTGGAGNDFLIGGLGFDILDGGAGNDVFVFNDSSESAVGAFRDQITSFAAGDKIDLSMMDADTGNPADVDFTFIGTDAFTGAGQIRYFVQSGVTYVEGNVNAGLGADFQIAIKNGYVPTAGDFMFTM